ncbi:MurR/RpiR family transcriptional regulator [Rhizobium sp. S163]|uniref:MurR/RpiR family transcriptional regulator n=1 Tax=Rhizobium sp. S163 TaxID=3055039 RepID=UPI0025A950F7|nr:MurR/RpiR family transcriptional regulator [Rhizobium sp. S163]MDM9648653.1 MurR/RpiR family transcriptional regulator [Rhizobium sp. S163]
MEVHDRTSSVLKDHFDRNRTNLSRSELVVAEHLVSMPIDVLIFRSAEEIAAETGTSDATVIRAARRLGFSGLPELKRICSRVMAQTLPTSERLEHRFRATGENLTNVAKQMFEAAREVVTATEEQFDENEVSHAVSILEQADTVWCLGIGTSEAEAIHCSVALSRVGLRTRCSGASGFTLANQLLDLRRDDVVVMFHALRDADELKLVVRQISEIGCKVILICGVQLKATYEGMVSALITCTSTPSKLASWSLGALVIADILSYGVAVRNQKQAIDSKARLSKLRAAISTR